MLKEIFSVWQYPTGTFYPTPLFWLDNWTVRRHDVVSMTCSDVTIGGHYLVLTCALGCVIWLLVGSFFYFWFMVTDEVYFYNCIKHNVRKLISGSKCLHCKQYDKGRFVFSKFLFRNLMFFFTIFRSGHLPVFMFCAAATDWESTVWWWGTKTTQG